MTASSLFTWQTFDDAKSTEDDVYGDEQGLKGTAADGLLDVRLGLNRDMRRMSETMWRIEVHHKHHSLIRVKDAKEVYGKREDAPLPLAAALAMVPAEQHAEVLRLSREHVAWLEKSYGEEVKWAGESHASMMADKKRTQGEIYSPAWRLQGIAEALRNARRELALVGYAISTYSEHGHSEDYSRLSNERLLGH